jgi:hypothetical protein
MAFLDFIRQRRASQAEAKPPQKNAALITPTWYSVAGPVRGAPAPTPSTDIAGSLTPAQEAKINEIREVMRKATAHIDQGTPRTAQPAPDNGGSNAAQLQKQTHQEKAQEALSPTDVNVGKTALQENEPSVGRSAERTPQTLPRRAPSWER